MKAYKKYILVTREHEKTTDSGIILTSQDAAARGIKVTVVSGQTTSIQEGDEIIIDRSRAIEIEGGKIFAIEPDYILAVV